MDYKEIGFNVLALLVAVATAFGYNGHLDPALAALVPAIVAVVNLSLHYAHHAGKNQTK